MTVRTNQNNQTGLLAQILAELQAQPAAWELMTQELTAIRLSLQRLEQFVAPAGQPNPTGLQAGMAHDLRRLALLLTGPSSTSVGTSYGKDVFTAFLQEGLDAWIAGAAAATRIQAAIWPTGQDAPEWGANNSMFWYLRHLVAASSALPGDPTPRQPLQVALMNLLDSSTGIGADTAWLVGALGGRVENKSAIDWLAQLAGCSCGDDAPPPSPGGCIQPTTSVAARGTGGRTWAYWEANSQAFALGVLTIAVDQGYPDGVGLTSPIWPQLSIFVSSRTAGYWRTGSDANLLLPTNEWLPVPLDSNAVLAVSVAEGQDLTVYICDALSQPEPPAPDWVALSSASGTVLTPEGVPDPDTPFGWAINSWGQLSLTSRLTNNQSGYTHQMTPGSYVDLPVAYTFYADVDVSVYQGAGGFVAVLPADTQVNYGPGTNFSFARSEGAFTLYARPVAS